MSQCVWHTCSTQVNWCVAYLSTVWCTSEAAATVAVSSGRQTAALMRTSSVMAARPVTTRLQMTLNCPAPQDTASGDMSLGPPRYDTAVELAAVRYRPLVLWLYTPRVKRNLGVTHSGPLRQLTHTHTHTHTCSKCTVSLRRVVVTLISSASHLHSSHQTRQYQHQQPPAAAGHHHRSVNYRRQSRSTFGDKFQPRDKPYRQRKHRKARAWNPILDPVPLANSKSALVGLCFISRRSSGYVFFCMGNKISRKVPTLPGQDLKLA